MRKSLFIFLIILYSVQLASAGDEVWINEQLKTGDVHLEAGTYIIEKPIVIQSDRTLSGDDAKIKLEDHAGWKAWVPIIQATGCNNIEICNIEIDVNSDNNLDVGAQYKDGKAHGRGHYNIIQTVNCKGVSVHDCYFHDGLGDGLRATNCEDVEFYDNRIEYLGHDAFFFIRSEGALVYGNRVIPRTNSAFRLWDSSHVRIFDNVVTGYNHWSAGNAAIQIEDSKGEMSDIEVCNNQIYDSYGSGMWLISYGEGTKNEQDIYIHHNLFSSCGAAPSISYVAGITIYGVEGTIIENNVFDSCNQASVYVWTGGDNTEINDNIIVNTQTRGGYGIKNSAGASLSIENNCFYNNVDDFYKCSSSTCDSDNPKTHETSSGWWWTGSSWECEEVKPSEMDYISDVEYGEDPKDEPDRNLESIFDILNVEYVDTGRTGQTADDIKLKLEGKSKGKITGAVKIIGFADVVYIDGVPYIPDEKSILVKHVAIMTPIDIWWNGGVSSFKKELKTEIRDGIAYATLNVSMRWYTVSENKETGNRKKKYHTSEATFEDSRKAPDVLKRKENITGYVHIYPTYFAVAVNDTGLTKITYTYEGNSSVHYLLIGERITDENGIIHTNFSSLEHWNGEIPHQGDWITVLGVFDRDKLKVLCQTPYEEVDVTNFTIINHEMPKRTVAAWVDPFIGLLIVLFLYMKYYWGLFKNQ